MKLKIFTFIIATFFIGCADKKKFNQTDEFWYKEVIRFIGNKDMDKADTSFTSLETEHIHSQLLETANILLINSHIQHENYILSNYYIDRYKRLFGTKKSRDYIEYLRIKSKFLAFKQPKRDQKLLLDTLSLIEDYLFDYSKSKYLPYIKTMETNLLLSKNNLNIDIIILYEKLDKPKAVEYYKSQFSLDWVNQTEIENPKSSFLRAIFE